jgi:hypothetical protein
VDELKAMKEEILSTDLLDVKLGGMSFTGWSWGNENVEKGKLT